MDVVMSGMCSQESLYQEWGCGWCGGLCPCSCICWGQAGWGMDRDLCICWQLVPQGPVSCHPLLPQFSITGPLSHHT